MRNGINKRTPRTNACLAKLTTKPPAELVAHSRQLEVELFVTDRDHKAVQLKYEEEVAARMEAEDKLLQLEKRVEAMAPFITSAGKMLKRIRPVRGTFDSDPDPNSDEDYGR